jgi:hypothetical protein
VVRAAHFLATPAVTADAAPFMHATAMQTNPTSALSTLTWAIMVYPHRATTIADLTIAMACVPKHRWVMSDLVKSGEILGAQAVSLIKRSPLSLEPAPRVVLNRFGLACRAHGRPGAQGSPVPIYCAAIG